MGRLELVDDKIVCKVSPEDFTAAAERIHSADVNIIVGCCGTGPEHVKAIFEKLT